jgi:hypothetical protein
VSHPTTTPGRDPAIAAFCRQHPLWECWKAISTRYYARLATDPAQQVMAEDLAGLSIEIRAHDDYLSAMTREETALQARLAQVGRRLDSGEYDAAAAREQGLRLREEHLVTTRQIRELRFGQPR